MVMVHLLTLRFIQEMRRRVKRIVSEHVIRKA